MADYLYYHNARCSKSRQGLSLLADNNIEVDIKEYLKVPLTIAEISTLFVALGFDSALQMLRAKEPEFILAGLSELSTNEDIIAAIVAFPKLLERPILCIGKTAVIGRPLENIARLVEL